MQSGKHSIIFYQTATVAECFIRLKIVSNLEKKIEVKIIWKWLEMNIYLLVVSHVVPKFKYISLRNKVETYQTFHPCHMDFFDGRMAGSRDRSWSRMRGSHGLSLG